MRLKPPKVLCDMAKLTALCFVAPVSAVVDPITHPDVRLAEPVLTSKLVLITICSEQCTDDNSCKENLKKQKFTKTLPVPVPHKSIKHAVIRENKCQEPKRSDMTD